MLTAGVCHHLPWATTLPRSVPSHPAIFSPPPVRVKSTLALSHSEVERRFRDFEWLNTKLMEKYKGQSDLKLVYNHTKPLLPYLALWIMT